VKFRVELRDRSFTLLEVLDKEIMSLSWDYARLGGCGGFSFSLPRRYGEEKFISGDFNVRIYIRDSSGTYNLWYQGLVENKSPSIVGGEETLSVTGHGYFTQLERYYVDEDYSSTEISAIVKDILDTYVVPNSDITYSTYDIDDTGFTADTLEINTNAKDAIQTCADIVGSREYGVDEQLQFFFIERSDTVGFRFPLGKKVTKYNPEQDFKDIVNRVIIQGGDVAGSPYFNTYDDSGSQLKYGRRDEIVENTAIVTDTVAAQYASAIFAEYRDVIRRATCELVNYNERIEANLPLPLVQILAGGTTYGEKYYGTFLYCGLINRQINKIRYSINNNGIMSISLDMGARRPNLSEEIAKLKFKIEQQRNYSL